MRVNVITGADVVPGQPGDEILFSEGAWISGY